MSAGVRYHLVYGRSHHEYRAARAARHENALASYAAPHSVRGVLRHVLLAPELGGRGRLIVDSGAFSLAQDHRY